MRIVSLLPAATETLCSLGFEDQLVGVSHECDFPASVLGLPKLTRSRIGSDAPSGEIDRRVREHARARQPLYHLDADLLEDLDPDIIVTQGLCNVCAVSEDEVERAACSLPSRPEIVNLEPRTLDDVLQGIRRLAERLGVGSRGDEVVGALTSRIEAVSARAARRPRPTPMVFLEWLDPPFCCGHWNPDLVRLAGGIDPLGQPGGPAVTVEWSQVGEARPEVVFIACCGFDPERTQKEMAALLDEPSWNRLEAVRAGRVHVADGARYFSRPGPRLVDSLEILAHALDPDVQPTPGEGTA